MNFDAAKQRINQILTAVSLRQKGFYSPYDHLSATSWSVEPYPAVKAMFSKLDARFLEFIDDISDYVEHIAAMRDAPGDPHWNTRWLSPLDMSAIYTFIAVNQPNRIIEVGCGVTTHTMARAIADHSLPTELTCIDPEPRIQIGTCPVNFLRRPFSEKDIALCAKLEVGDVLFIDSSHFMQQGFDVDILFNRVFFEIQAGVVVHIHDIFLPFGYPDTWNRLRFNEQNALIGWLSNGYLEVLFAAHYVWRSFGSEIERRCPGLDLSCTQNGGSIWLRKQ